ncbi:MAG: GntR family transcriptional regulator [Phycisphaerales bacterium]
MTWADFISKDLAGKISKGKLDDDNLTLQSLCSQYKVSITPVRLAIDILIGKGVLQRDKSNRLKIRAGNKNGLKSLQAEISEHPADLYEKISKQLVIESLSGKAHYLRESATAEKYQTGRTVIRGIFNRLAGEGIIEHVPRCGWRLRPFDKQDLQSFLQVREVLELKALELAKDNLDIAVLKQMFDKNVIDKHGQEVRADNSVHSYLIKQSGNRYIKDFFEHYGKYYDILFMCEDTDLPSRKLAAKQHRKILNALIKSDWKQAKIALTEHIRINHFVLHNKPGLILTLMGHGNET